MKIIDQQIAPAGKMPRAAYEAILAELAREVETARARVVEAEAALVAARSNAEAVASAAKAATHKPSAALGRGGYIVSQEALPAREEVHRADWYLRRAEAALVQARAAARYAEQQLELARSGTVGAAEAVVRAWGISNDGVPWAWDLQDGVTAEDVARGLRGAPPDFGEVPARSLMDRVIDPFRLRRETEERLRERRGRDDNNDNAA